MSTMPGWFFIPHFNAAVTAKAKIFFTGGHSYNHPNHRGEDVSTIINNQSSATGTQYPTTGIAQG
jgi:hypothetical protein